MDSIFLLNYLLDINYNSAKLRHITINKTILIYFKINIDKNYNK